MLHCVQRCQSPEDGMREIKKVLDNGGALSKFCQMLIAQGVSEENAQQLCGPDVKSAYNPLPKAKFTTPLVADHSGD